MRYTEHKSETGNFQELARSKDVVFGQLSMLTINPKCSRGGHYHKRKREWFCCLRGSCHLVFANLEGRQTHSVTLHEGNREFVAVEPNKLHTVLNPSYKECVLLIIASEEYNPNDADTYKIGVGH